MDPDLLQGRGQGRRERPASRPAPRDGAAPQAPPPDAEAEAREERARLRWDDAVRHGEGFVKWTRVEVPGLKDVEVGGWKPGALVTPPPSEMPALLEKHHAFLMEIISWLPRAEFAETKVEGKGGDVYELSCSIGNEGRLPFRIASGVRTAKPRKTKLVLSPGEATLLFGEKFQRVEDLTLGKRQTFKWVLHAKPGTKVKLTFTTELAGRGEKEVELR